MERIHNSIFILNSTRKLKVCNLCNNVKLSLIISKTSPKSGSNEWTLCCINHSKNLTIMFQTSKTTPPWITQLYIPLEFEFMTYSGSLYKLLQTTNYHLPLQNSWTRNNLFMKLEVRGGGGGTAGQGGDDICSGEIQPNFIKTNSKPALKSKKITFWKFAMILKIEWNNSPFICLYFSHIPLKML